MRSLVIVAALVALVGAMTVKDMGMDVVLGKDSLVNKDIKTKELYILKLLNHILQPCMYKDIVEVAKEWMIEDHKDMFVKTDVVKKFMEMYKMGMLPRGEVFVMTNERHIMEAIKVFHLLYFAKDFDTMIRCACYLRDRINPGMFVYALTITVLHRDDCRGIILPPPYEIYPYFFVNTDVIHKAFMMKMKRGVIDTTLMKYYNIMVNDKMVIIDSRKGVRHTLTHDDMLNYFTEDIDLNTYYYYFHMDYPLWMADDIFTINKERRGEIMMYMNQQLLARYRLERLSHGMCDIKPFTWSTMLKTGYWPKIMMHNGEVMPTRMANEVVITENNVMMKKRIDDMERLIRDAIMTGKLEMRDGTVYKIKKTEDLEILCRLILGNLGWKDDAKHFHLMNMFRKLLTYNLYNVDKYTYVPTSLDIVETCLRDPLFWRLMKRIHENIDLFKTMLPKYTRDEFNFPGVKVENIVTDKLVTFMDEYDMDITNAVFLDKIEMTKMKSDVMYIARQRRLNHHSFKVTIDVVSDKTVDSVVRIFLGPKYDCMGRLMTINDKRLDMVEIDSFLYKLETGKNVIVRDSMDMHNMVHDKMWTKKLWDRELMEHLGMNSETITRESYWYKSRIGFPHRLLLPMGKRGGMELQMFVIVTPVRTGLTLNTLDIDTMRLHKNCRFTVCIDTMPLGFPFDRKIDTTHFFTMNMRFTDVIVFHKDLETMNVSKDVDMTMMVMRRDDLTYMDKDMLVRRTFIDPYIMNTDKMMEM